MLTRVESLDELDRLMAEASATGNEAERVARLVGAYIDDPRLRPDALDPMSPEYAAEVLRIHGLVSGRSSYDPSRDELSDLDPQAWARRPNIYRGDSVHLGTFLEAIGQVIKVVPVKAGDRVLEFGPGEGQICLPLARMGCDVSVIDIEDRNLEAIRIQAAALDVAITCHRAEFDDPLPPGPFDLVLFFEAFHHALRHRELLVRIGDVLAEQGRIVLAGEPIIEDGSYWTAVVPFPWGLRIDGLSLSAVRHYGWMELGFQESYLVEAAMRSGFLVEKVSSPTNGRANAYVLRKWPTVMPFEEPILFPPHLGQWHGPEGDGRWSSGSVTLPLPDAVVGRTITIEVAHRASASRDVAFRSGAGMVALTLRAGSTASVEIDVLAPRVEIRSTIRNGDEARRRRVDPRELGIFVKRITRGRRCSADRDRAALTAADATSDGLPIP